MRLCWKKKIYAYVFVHDFSTEYPDFRNIYEIKLWLEWQERSLNFLLTKYELLNILKSHIVFNIAIRQKLDVFLKIPWRNDLVYMKCAILFINSTLQSPTETKHIYCAWRWET